MSLFTVSVWSDQYLNGKLDVYAKPAKTPPLVDNFHGAFGECAFATGEAFGLDALQNLKC